MRSKIGRCRARRAHNDRAPAPARRGCRPRTVPTACAASEFSSTCATAATSNSRPAPPCTSSDAPRISTIGGRKRSRSTKSSASTSGHLVTAVRSCSRKPGSFRSKSSVWSNSVVCRDSCWRVIRIVTAYTARVGNDGDGVRNCFARRRLASDRGTYVDLSNSRVSRCCTTGNDGDSG